MASFASAMGSEVIIAAESVNVPQSTTKWGFSAGFIHGYASNAPACRAVRCRCAVSLCHAVSAVLPG
jgi:hypothetical protein